MSRRQARGKAYPHEFRENVVQIAQTGNRRLAAVAAEFEVSTDSVRRWVKQAELDEGVRKDGTTSDERKELRRLRRVLRRVRMERDILAESSSLVRSGDRFDPVSVFKFVRARRRRWPVGCMCRVLGVSTSGYYAWLKRGPSRRAQANEAFSKRIAEIHEASHGQYGARRVHAELLASGDKLSRQRVARLMRTLGLKGGQGGGKGTRPARSRGAQLSGDR
ncbi:MAG: IS3 family transposase [Bryobacterales bacterium]|nr:IS3 family transposase [Bryobacterales bacterium]